MDPVLAALEKRGYGGVFYLHGDDQLRKEEFARALVDAHLEGGTRDFNLDVFRGAELDLEHLASVMATPPLMARWRVVVVRETEALAADARARALLVGAAKDPPPDLALVLLATPPSKARFYQDLQRHGRAVDFRALSVDDVPGWLMSRAREAWGMELEEAAARALATAVGQDLGVAVQELGKLASFAEPRGRVTVEDVEAAGTRLPKQDRWQWFDLVGARRFREALEGLPVLLAHGESGVGLIIGLTTQMLRIGVVVEQGARALESLLPPHQRWLAGRLAGQARGWTGVEVERAIAGLLRADALLKSGRLTDEHLLEEWLLVRLGAREEAA